MSTHAIIAKVYAETKTVKAIHVSFDGYPEGVGRALLDHYNDPQKVDQLISLGAIDFPKENFEEIERLQSPAIEFDMYDFIDKAESNRLLKFDGLYLYVMGVTGQWRVSDNTAQDGFKEFDNLKELLSEEK